MNLPAAGLARLIVIVLAATLLGGCATTGERDPRDPWEPMNRGFYTVNDAIDRAALRPTAVAYRDYVPSLIRTGVGNFFTNLSNPGTALNQLLQGKPVQAGQDLARFVINTTLGWGGIFDVASGAHLPQHDEDIGQTLGKWGVPAGPYLMIPGLGPSSVRDFPSSVATRFLQPLFWFDLGNARWGSFALSLVDTRARLLALDPAMEGVYDRYAFIRDAFLQRRWYMIHDGNPPEEPVDPEMQKLIDEADAELPPPTP
jgi:phospholipid-binding lipoprotein MlaA